MRWEWLVDDLESQLAAAQAAELQAEVADRSQAEVGRLRIVDRLRGAGTALVTVRLREGGRVIGVVEEVGADWVLLAERPTGEGLSGPAPTDVLVPLGAIVLVDGLPPSSSEPGSEGAVQARARLPMALRALARRRTRVVIGLSGNERLPAVLERVGADFVEVSGIADVDAGPRSRRQVVPLAALLYVRGG